MSSTADQEWYVAAAVFTLHAVLALVFFAVWIALFIVIFFAIAWLAARV